MSFVVNLNFALDEDKKVIYIKDAPKKQIYVCPSCGGEVIPVKGEIMAWHFRHKAESSCTNESVEHATAKKMLADVLSEGEVIPLACRDIITYARCDNSRARIEIKGTPKLETSHENYRIDVGVFSGETLEWGLEVVVTSKMSERKAANHLPIFEVFASKIMRWFQDRSEILAPYRWSDGAAKKMPFNFCGDFGCPCYREHLYRARGYDRKDSYIHTILGELDSEVVFGEVDPILLLADVRRKTIEREMEAT